MKPDSAHVAFNDVNCKAMPMALDEYCSWHFNARALQDIFGLPPSAVLPSLKHVIDHEIEIGMHSVDDLNFLSHVLEAGDLTSPVEFESVINELAIETLKKLSIDTSFPTIKQSAKTICRWIISQENLITKNLDPQKRLVFLEGSIDYHNLFSIFSVLTRVFRDCDFDSSASDNKNLYYFYFNSIVYRDDNPDLDSLRAQLEQLSVPVEYQHMWDLLFDFYCDNSTVDGWIDNEVKIIELAKQCYKVMVE